MSSAIMCGAHRSSLSVSRVSRGNSSGLAGSGDSTNLEQNFTHLMRLQVPPSSLRTSGRLLQIMAILKAGRNSIGSW